jgi:replicative DNA helicase
MISTLTRPESDGSVKALPSSLEAEQALLGAILYDNGALERVPEHFSPAHLFEPFHQRLYVEMAARISSGQLAEPIGLMERFKKDPAFEKLGGLSYLANLVEYAPTAAYAPDLAQTVYALAVRRQLIAISGDIAAAANDPEVPAKEQVEAAEAALFGLGEHGAASSGPQPFSTSLIGAINSAAAAFNRGGGLSGISTGLIDMDKLLGGLHPSDLVIIAGRPSQGKTALATNIAFHVARSYRFDVLPDGSQRTTDGGRVLFFSLEMSGEQLASRILAEVSGVASDRVRKGEINASEFGRLRDAATEIDAVPLHIDDTGALAIAKLSARARRLKRTSGLDLIVVDYLQLVTAGGKGADNRVQEVSAITQGLKALAKDLNVPVIALSQLSRQVENREDKRPQLSDLRESGSIEQDADMVMFVYREAYYLGRAEPKTGTAEHLAWQDDMSRCAHEADVIVGKQRHGPIGTVKLHFNPDLTKFGNLARESRYGEVVDFSQSRGGRSE